MSIPKTIKIKRHPSPGLRPPSPRGRGEGEGLPTSSGVYLFKDGKGKVVYVGKASSLKNRVGSYFQGTDSRRLKMGWPRITDPRIAQMVEEVRRIDYQVTDSVIEALILEANLIRKYMPKYNVKEKDDKSFLYVVVTKGEWPRVMLVRGSELSETRNLKLEIRGEFPVSPPKADPPREDSFQFHKIFGPYTSASAIRAAMDLIRKWFPWGCMTRSTTKGKNEAPRKPCFDYHIGRCPGVCVGAISRREYMKNIRNVILMLEGKKGQVIKNVKLKMQNAAKAEKFEEAEMWRRKLFALQHIRDVAVLTADSLQPTAYSSSSKPLAVSGKPINILGRIEGYDISNISGTSAVGSMVVFQDGEPAKSEYRRFRIKAVKGINDVAMLREVLQRRFKRITNHESRIMGLKKDHDSLFMPHDSQIWPLPDLLVIDGGWGQVNAVQEVVDDWARTVLHQQRTVLAPIPIVGIAKGFKRKQDRPIFDKNNLELARIVENSKDLLLRVRDEAHRFAIAYHRKVRSKRLST